MGIEIDAVQGCVDWHSSRNQYRGDFGPAGDIRLVRMKAKRAKDEDETRRKIRKSLVAGDEVVRSYQNICFGPSRVYGPSEKKRMSRDYGRSNYS